jgi:RNA polymerase sigma-70 factor (ECF subfamily)
MTTNLSNSNPSHLRFAPHIYIVSSISKAPPEEVALVAQLQSGSKEAMSLLYDRYSPALFGVIFKIVANQELAEDLLQDCLLKIWRNIHSYDSVKGRLYTWMLNIARNVAIDASRSSAFKAAQSNQELTDVVHIHTSGRSNDRPIDTIGVRELVDQLKPEHRELIDMMYFKGLSQSEIADQTGLPLGTVKTRVRAAMSTLRSYFA